MNTLKSFRAIMDHASIQLMMKGVESGSILLK